VRWLVLSLLWGSGAPSVAQSVDALARAYREAGAAAPAHAALMKFAAEHPRDQAGALAHFALAQGALQAGRNEEALADFQIAARRLPELADFAHFGAARALVALGRKNDAVGQYEAVAAHVPLSSQMPWAVLAAGSLLIEAGSGEAAVRLAARYLKQMPAPQGAFLYGSALEAAGRRDAAAMELYKVYYEYPKSDEARRAEPILARLQPGPPVPAGLVLSRARKLIEGGEAARGAATLQQASASFAAPDREMASALTGASRYFLRDYAGALQYLKTLRVDPAGDADAERLFYIVQAARRLDRYGDVDDALRQLAGRHPKSRLRMEALSGAANRFLISNDHEGYEPLFTACAGFAPDPEAALCHWKLSWNHYLRKQPDAPSLFRQHLERFPGSEDAAAAMYFLGRISEREGRMDAAKAHYQTVSLHYPNYYYAVISRERLRTPALTTATASAATLEFLQSAKLPPPGSGADFAMDEPTRVRLSRSRLLVRAASDDLAQTELRFAMRNGAKPTLCGMELSRMALARGENGPALRAIKGVSQGSLTWRLEDAPKEFWKLAYPWPYREQLERYAEDVSIDPYVVAGLIRQESEFDPAAVSRSNARGLTQVMPATGREVSRRLGIRNFTVGLLHQPDSSLRIGINYLRQMLNSFDNKWFLTLAAYNAGPGRAHMWVKWAEFNEPAEFIETIPFHETRGYVQTVLRNADLYRRIWEGSPRPPPVAVAAVVPQPPPVVRPKPKPAVAGRRVPAAPKRPAPRR
jgi:soluble lytic murein transglycosylase